MAVRRERRPRPRRQGQVSTAGIPSLRPCSSGRDNPAEPSGPELRLTAYHEAGHAVMALLHGRPVEQVTIRGTRFFLGKCEMDRGRFGPRQDELEAAMLILLGGMAAEARLRGVYELNGAAQDLRELRKLSLRRAANNRQAERLERRLLNKVEALLDEVAVWQAVEKIAAELLARETISGRAARHLFDECQRDVE
jgi:hypothetical protein